MARRNRNYQQGEWGGQTDFDFPQPHKAAQIIIPTFTNINKRLPRFLLKNTESPNLINVRLNRGYVEPRPGYGAVIVTLDNVIVGVFQFTLSSGENVALIMTLKSIYYSYDLTTFTRIPWTYTTGTATIHVGDPTVIHGTSTLWNSTGLRAGDRFKVDALGTYVTISSIDSETQITLTSAYPMIGSTMAYTVDRYFGGTSTAHFWGTSIADMDYFIFSQGVDPVAYVTSSLNLVRRLSSGCPASKYGMMYGDRVILGNIPSYPFNIQYSADLNYDDWSGVGSGSKSFVEDPGVIMGMSVIGDTAVVYKKDCIYNFDRTGIASSPFSYKKAYSGIGNYIGRSLQSMGSYDMFVGMDDIYTYDLRDPVGVGALMKDDFFDTLAHGYIDTADSVVVKQFNEYQLFVPTANNTSPNKCYVYNYLEKVWMGEWSIGVTACGNALQESNETWDSAVGIWDTDTAIWDSNSLVASFPIIFIANGASLYKEDPNVSGDNGVEFTFQVETKDFITEDNTEISSYRFVIDYYGIGATLIGQAPSLTLSYSADGGATWENEVTKQLDISQSDRLRHLFYDVITTAQSISVKVTALGGRFKIVRMRLEIISSGEVIA